MSIILKVSYHDELRRITAPKGINIQNLKQLLSENVTQTNNFTIKYQDDEGDFVSLSSDLELEEAIRQTFLRSQPALRINLTDLSSPLRSQANSRSETHTMPNVNDSQDVKFVVHEGVQCNACGFPLVGIRYKCGICVEYNLCEDCEKLQDIHPIDHPLLKIRVPLPPTFQSVHVIATNLHLCRGQISRVLNQPQIAQAAGLAKANWSSLKEEVAQNFQNLSEQVITKAKEIKDELLEVISQEKSKMTDLFEGITQSVTNGISSAPINLETQQPISQSHQVHQQQPTHPQLSQPVTETRPSVVEISRQTDQSPPQETSLTVFPYQDKLTLLSEMGFTDRERNIQLLNTFDGDITRCLQVLL
jgi:hypothetical protein